MGKMFSLESMKAKGFSRFSSFFFFLTELKSFGLQPLAPPAGDLGQCHPLVETGFYSVVKWP